MEKYIHQLFQRLSENEQAALWELHEQYFHRIHRYVFCIVRNKETTEEVTNDVFIGIWQNRSKLSVVEKPEIYLFVCAKNLALKQLQQKKIQTECFPDEPLAYTVEQGPEEKMISNETIQAINRSIESLPEKCKMIFILVKENNLKYREVAALLDLSVKTVEAQMSIALKKLSQSLLPTFS